MLKPQPVAATGPCPRPVALNKVVRTPIGLHSPKHSSSLLEHNVAGLVCPKAASSWWLRRALFVTAEMIDHALQSKTAALYD